MTVVLKPASDGSIGLQGTDLDAGGFIPVVFNYDAASVDRAVFTATRQMVVTGIIGRPSVIGTDAGAVTAVVKKAASGTAIASGTAVNTGTYNLKGTIHTNQVLALSATAADLVIPAGTSVGVDFTGVLTAAIGSITLMLAPA